MSLVTFTTLDIAHATKYAATIYSQIATKNYLDKLNIEYSIVEQEWDAIMLKGLDPENLEKKIKFVFDDPKKCRSIACFEYNKYSKCSSFDQQLVVDDGPNTYLACQPICKKFTTPVDTVFVDGKCRLVDQGLKQYCLIPSRRSDTKDDYSKVPPFIWDNKSNTCTTSLQYCNHFTMTLQEGECKKDKFISTFEFIFGKTATRYFGNAFYYTDWRDHWQPPSSIPRPDLPQQRDDPKIVENQLRRHADVHATSRENDEDYYDKKVIGTRVVKEITKQILENLSIYLAADISPVILSMLASVGGQVLTAVLPEAVVSGALAAGSAIEAIFSEGLLLTVTEGIGVTVAGVLTVLNPIALLLLAASITGVVLDAVDPYHIHSELKHFVDAPTLKLIERSFHDSYSYYSTGNQRFKELTELSGSMLWLANNDITSPSTERLTLTLLKSAHYLKSLKYNSLGQTLSWEKEDIVKGVDVDIDHTHTKVPVSQQKNIFQPPNMGRAAAWIGAALVGCGSAYLCCFEYSNVFFVILTLAFALFSMDVLKWWVANDKISGNIFSYHDRQAEQTPLDIF